jgi:hypothetical protein
MKVSGIIWMMVLFIVISITASGQQFLLIESTRNFKNYKYFLGDNIRVKIRSEGRIIEGEITGLNDSSLYLGSWEEILFNDIEIIYRQRTFIPFIRGVLLVAGVGYFAVDSFNRLINNDSPVILSETVLISGGLVASNFLLIPLRYKRIHAERWQFTYIDFGQLDYYPFTAP